MKFLNSEKDLEIDTNSRLHDISHLSKRTPKKWRANRENLVSNLESRWSVLVEGQNAAVDDAVAEL